LIASTRDAGDYMVQFEGLNMRREALPVAWYRFSVAR
jgi:hypothetical protein